MKEKVIIDTDPGCDDALALLLAFKSDIFDIKAITTVAGNSNIENTTKNAKLFLKFLNKKTPIYSGEGKPLRRKLVKSKLHGEKGLGNIISNENINLKNNAIKNIISLIKKNPKKITLISLGPLTNIAKAIIRDSETMSKLNRIVIMGGTLKTKGNMRSYSEFNFFVDPEAVEIVFKSSIKKTLIPLDACKDISLDLGDICKIKNKKIRDFILSLKKFDSKGKKVNLVYDSLAVHSLINPKSCNKRNYDLSIDTKSKRGRVYTSNKNAFRVEVVEKISKRKFKKDFIKILSK